MLLDCGEGSYGQIVNHYGEDTADVIRQLKMIFISHLHADHHLVRKSSISLFSQLAKGVTTGVDSWGGGRLSSMWGFRNCKIPAHHTRFQIQHHLLSS